MEMVISSSLKVCRHKFFKNASRILNRKVAELFMVSMKFTIQLPVALLFNIWIYAFKYLHNCQFRGFATKLKFICIRNNCFQHLFISVVENVTLIGHNWGFLAGIHVLRKHPEWFDSLIILNTNNLPDVSFHEFMSGFMVEFFTVLIR